MRYNENGNSVNAIDRDLLSGLRLRKQFFDYDIEYSLDFMLSKGHDQCFGSSGVPKTELV